MIHATNSNSLATYVLVMNTDNHSLAEYVNFPFNSIANMGDICFAASSDGIYIIDEGITDDNLNIDAEIQAGLFDTMTAISKEAIITGWVIGNVSTSGGLDVVVSVDNGDVYTYPAIPDNSGSHAEMRAKFGRGLNPKGRYVQCGIKNKQGAAFIIDNMRVYSYPPRKRR